MHISTPRLRDAQSGSGAPHSAQRSFPGILLRILETESTLLNFLVFPKLSVLSLYEYHKYQEKIYYSRDSQFQDVAAENITKVC